MFDAIPVKSANLNITKYGNFTVANQIRSVYRSTRNILGLGFKL